MARFAAEQWVPAKLHKVFEFFCDPQNFVVIMPPEIGTRILQLEKLAPSETGRLAEAAGKGTRIEFSFRTVPLLPFRMKWLAEVVEFVPYERFRDIQVRGPFKTWEHTHGFVAQTRNATEGTLITDEILYTVGLSSLGGMADETIIRLALARTFAHRRRIVEKLLAGGNA